MTQSGQNNQILGTFDYVDIMEYTILKSQYQNYKMIHWK
jgi:hypothetical protein